MRASAAFSLPAWGLLVTALVPPACAQDANQAKRFLEEIYRHYDHHGPGIDFTGSNSKKVFDSSLIQLVQADKKALGPDEAGVLDGDPICGCQDWDGIWNLKIAVQMLGVRRATATVSFALFAPKPGSDSDLRLLEITLVPESGQWRIDNIVDKSNPRAPFSLRVELENEIVKLKGDKRPRPSHR